MDRDVTTELDSEFDKRIKREILDAYHTGYRIGRLEITARFMTLFVCILSAFVVLHVYGKSNK